MTDELALLRRTARRFLADHASAARTRRSYEVDARIDRELWREMASLGWLTMSTEDDDLGIRALAVIAEELGSVVFDQPVLIANIVARAIARSATAEQRDRYLAPLTAGELVATGDVGQVDIGIEAMPTRRGHLLRGDDVLMERGDEADLILASAKVSDGTVVRYLVPARTPGVSAIRSHSLDLGRRYARVSFDDVEIDAAARLGDPDGDGSGKLAVALACAESLGSAARAFEITLDYMRTRVVFGRLLGSYQVIKHRLTDMSLWLETSRALTEAAIDAVARADGAAAETASIAKAYLSEKMPLLARDCVQLHGGIGFTWEHDIHLYLRRIESNALALGGVDEHLLRIAGGLLPEDARTAPRSEVAAS